MELWLYMFWFCRLPDTQWHPCPPSTQEPSAYIKPAGTDVCMFPPNHEAASIHTRLHVKVVISVALNGERVLSSNVTTISVTESGNNRMFNVIPPCLIALFSLSFSSSRLLASRYRLQRHVVSIAAIACAASLTSLLSSWTNDNNLVESLDY